jgi:peptidyl-prolyl cis-trans isomerase SurA
MKTLLTASIALAGAAALLTPIALAEDKPAGNATRTAERSSELPPVSVDVGGTSVGKGKARPGGARANTIVALVNDEPITGFEIEQRAMMLGGSNVQTAAKAAFQQIVKNPNTTKRLRGILEQIVKANPGKSRDEVIEIFEQRKKQFGISLQQEALNKAKSAALPKARKQALE